MPKPLELGYIEEDSGLWIVRNVETAHVIGAIFDGGARGSGNRTCVRYDALDAWHSHIPGNLIGSSRTLRGALAILRRWYLEGSQPTYTLPEYHPSMRKEPSIGYLLGQFAMDIAHNPADTIWQPEWHALRARAQSLADKFLNQK